jgi:hypothetical protein
MQGTRTLAATGTQNKHKAIGGGSMSRAMTYASRMAVMTIVLAGLLASKTMAQRVRCPCFTSGELVGYVRAVDAVGDEGIQFFFCGDTGDGQGLRADSTSGDFLNMVIASTQHAFIACSVNFELKGHLIKSTGSSDLSAAELSACDLEIQTACEELGPIGSNSR